jgi:elongation factor G
MEGRNRVAVTELKAGDIGATLKLRSTHVNNTLHDKGTNIELVPISFPNPDVTIAISVVNKGDEEKLSQVLHTLQEEDATVRFEVSPERRQTLLHCHGELHLKVQQWKIDHIHKLDVKFDTPKIPYRETISRVGAKQLPSQKTKWWSRAVCRSAYAGGTLV